MKNKEKLKELLEKLKKDEIVVDDYIETFNKYYKTEQSKDINTKLLENIYINFITFAYEPTKLNRFLTKNLAQVVDELTNTFNEEQRRIYEVYEMLNVEYSKMQELRAFTYAYCFANEIRQEVNNFRNETFNNNEAEQRKELEKIYYNIYATTHEDSPDESKNLINKIVQKESNLKAELTQEQKKLLDELVSLEHERDDIVNKNVFINAIMFAKKFI